MIRLSRVARVDHLIIEPLSSRANPWDARPAECAVIAQLHDAGATIHAARVGSLVLAQNGLLDGREATHWAGYAAFVI